MSSPEIIKIKELNLDLIQPNSSTMNKTSQGGVKIVVIGKPGCFSPGTKILKYDGSISNVEDIKVGDVIMGDDSTPRNVLELCHNTDKMYTIIPDSGESYTVNKLHKLVLINTISNNETIEITVENYLKKSIQWKQNYAIFRRKVNFKDRKVEIDPYILGLWLGKEKPFSSELEFFSDIEKLYRIDIPNIYNKNYDYKDIDSFIKLLKENNILTNKHIPSNYKINNEEKRLNLLAGIIDSNGSYDINNHHFIISHSSIELLNDILFVARTLGFTATLQSENNNTNEKYYTVNITGNIISIPCNMIKVQNVSNTNNLISNFKIQAQGEGEYYGFTLDGNHRFLLSTCDVVRNTGKSTLISSLLYAKKHIFPTGMFISGSEDTNGFYKKFVPNSFIYTEYNEEKIKDFIRRQKIAMQHLPNPWSVLLLDDCTDDPKIFNKPLQHGIFKRGRHWKMLYILSLQYAMDVKPVIRTNIDGIFILREPIMKNRKSLWENYASIIPDFTLFCEIMDQITNDYTALYIHNASPTNDWRDSVFWYKANIPPKDFKFGSKDYWDFHLTRYNNEYVEPFV